MNAHLTPELWDFIVLSALGLGGPVFALIEQPTYGWGDPLVLIPLLAGLACFAGSSPARRRPEPRCCP